jgi:hypothetical protein
MWRPRARRLMHGAQCADPAGAAPRRCGCAMPVVATLPSHRPLINGVYTARASLGAGARVRGREGARWMVTIGTA